jgi:hypothetical protein
MEPTLFAIVKNLVENFPKANLIFRKMREEINVKNFKRNNLS